MASINNVISKSLFDKVLPSYGNARVQMPSWDDSQRMFICKEYESANGHRYYCGVRFCNNIVIVEKVGLYHTWTYLDGIEIYAFNGTRLELVQKQDYEKQFRDEAFVREESVRMLKNYLQGVMKMNGTSMAQDALDAEVKAMVDGCYKSFLDEDFNTRLTQILPALENKRLE